MLSAELRVRRQAQRRAARQQPALASALFSAGLLNSGRSHDKGEDKPERGWIGETAYRHWSCKTYGAYRISPFETAILLEDAGADPGQVGLPAKVPMLDSDGCMQICWLGDGQIELDYMDVFVKARRSN